MRLFLMTLIAIPLAALSSHAFSKATPETSYQSPGKPGMKVQMDYTVSKERVAVGETVDISVNFKGSQLPSAATLKTSKQLVLHGDKELSLQKAGADQKSNFSVTPMTEGIHLVTIVAEDAQMSHKKPFAIRIVAGNKPIEQYLQTNGTLKVDENGQKIISMPAEER